MVYVQISSWTKVTVAFILSLRTVYVPIYSRPRQETNELTAISASIAALVRLKYLVKLGEKHTGLCSSASPFNPKPTHLTNHSLYTVTKAKSDDVD